MPQDNAAAAGVISEAPATAQTASTAAEPQTETQSTSTSLMEKMGVPAEVQAELKALRTPEQPETVTPETTEAPAEVVDTPPPTISTDEQHEEDEPKAPDHWPEAMQQEFTKRVGKEAGKRRRANERADKAEAALEQAQAQLEAVQPVTVVPNSGDLLANVRDHQQLAQAVQEARLTRDWCRKHSEGFIANEGQENQQIVSAEEIADTLGQAEDIIQIYAPAKNQQLLRAQQSDAVAKQKYPNIFKRDHPDYVRRNAMLRRLPTLANDPDANVFIGHFLRGFDADAADHAGNKKANTDLPPALTRPIPPLAPHVPAISSRNGNEPSNKKVSEAKNQVVQQGGDRDSVVGALRAIREAAAKKTDSRSLVAV